MDTHHLTTKEAATRMRVAESTLKNWRVSGLGPRFVRFGRKVVYPIAELEAFEAQGLHTTTHTKAAGHDEGRE